MSRHKNGKTRRNRLPEAMPRSARADQRRAAMPQRNIDGGRPDRGPRQAGASSTTAAQHVLSTGLHSAREAVMRAAQSAITTIKENPLPLALTGLGAACAGAGIVWWMRGATKRTSDGSSTTESMRAPPSSTNGKNGAFTERIGATVKEANEAVTNAGRAASEKVSRLAHDIAMRGRRLEHSVEEIAQEHPLAVGAALFAAGAAVGLAIPRSQLENTWLGRERDQLVSSAQKLARSAVQRVESFAKDIGDSSSAQA